MAVFLVVDKYEHNPNPRVISATSLMKSVRQIILSMRAEASDVVTDVSDLLASRLGTAIHEAVEDAWLNHYKQALLDLGQPKRVVDAVRINPAEPEEDTIPIYLELRSEKDMGKWIVSGCCDLIFNGMIQDVKSTGTFSYTTSVNDAKYQLQLSIYRWLNPDKVTEPHGAIQFLFKDWSKLQATINRNYPSMPVVEKKFELLSVQEVHTYVMSKLSEVDRYEFSPEAELPLCNDDDLWIRESAWKYYSKPEAKRATKDFKANKAEAYQHMYSKGTGIVREIKGKAVACGYCSAKNRCSQYHTLKAQGQA